MSFSGHLFNLIKAEEVSMGQNVIKMALYLNNLKMTRCDCIELIVVVIKSSVPVSSHISYTAKKIVFHYCTTANRMY